MLRTSASLLLPLLIRDTAAAAQESELREAVRAHAAGVSAKSHDPYGRSAVHYPALRLTLLPATGGAHRRDLRSALAAGGAKAPGEGTGEAKAKASGEGEGAAEAFRRVTAGAAGAAGPRAVLVGCRSLPYARRQLRSEARRGAGPAADLLVVDHALDTLLEMALALVPEFGPRVQFVRGDALFVMQSLMPAGSADVCVAPMPVPFHAERSSHRRLITREFLCATHNVLRARKDATDSRGFVTFTDTEGLAEFMMEQLEESRLLVPWTRKNPATAYAQWLPVEGEFVRQKRTENLIALAASKSGETSKEAKAFIEAIDFKRRYHRALHVV